VARKEKGHLEVRGEVALVKSAAFQHHKRGGSKEVKEKRDKQGRFTRGGVPRWIGGEPYIDHQDLDRKVEDGSNVGRL